MKKIKAIITVVMFTFLAISCTKEASTNLSNDGVFIRIKNTSIYLYEDIVVEAGMTTNNYEDLEPNQMSEYQKFDRAYTYAFVQLEIEGGIFTIQPIDFVGETPLEDGFYTYEINANDSEEQYGRLGLLFIED